MDTAQAKAKYQALGRKLKDTNRKGWEIRKAFAKECGIDVKVFSKGLGPQFDRFVAVVRGVMDIKAYVPVDERSLKSLYPEKAKLDQIFKTYAAVIKPNTKPATTPQYWGWTALDDGLRDMQNWADDVIKTSDKRIKELQAKRKS